MITCKRCNQELRVIRKAIRLLDETEREYRDNNPQSKNWVIQSVRMGYLKAFRQIKELLLTLK